MTRELSIPSIGSVAAGLHDDGDTVTVTGILNEAHYQRTKQGNDWMTARLIGEHTAIQIQVLPKFFAEYRDMLGPIRTPDRHLNPPTITVTGRVNTLYHRKPPPVHVTEVVCQGHEQHGPHPDGPLPARLSVKTDLSMVDYTIGRAMEVIENDPDNVPEPLATVISELHQVLSRHGYCEPRTPLSDDEGASIAEARALLRAPREGE